MFTGQPRHRITTAAFRLIDGDTLHFQVVSCKGETVDSGSFQRPGAALAASAANGQ